MKLSMTKNSPEPAKSPLSTPQPETEVDLYPPIPPSPAFSEILMTPAAAIQIQKIIDSENSSADGIRAGVKGGGCAGLSYKLDLETAKQEGDRVYESPSGVKLYVDKKSFLFLAGTVLDYAGGLNGHGFEFHNPNASSTCGCGSSFSA